MSKPELPVKRYFCFICGLIYEDKNRRVGLFSVTKTNLPLWKSLIPQLKHTSRLCDAHFDEKDIVKGYYIRQDFIAAEKWRLTRTAIPKYFLVRDKATASKCYQTSSKLQLSENTERVLKGKRANPRVLNSTPLPGPQGESPIETSKIGKVATSSGVKCNPRKSLKHLMTLDSASSNSPKKNKIIGAQSDESTSREPTAFESTSNQDDHSYHSKSNSPEGITTLNSTPMQPTLELTVTIGNSVPTTLVNHSSSPDSTPGPEDVATTTNTHRQETDLRDSSAPIMNNAAMNDIPDPATVNVAALSSVSLKKPRQKRRFIPLVNCSKCSKEIKGKCSSCLIKELKSIIYEKDKEIKELKSKDKIQVKTISRKDHKIISLKDRIKQYRKKLNTSAHRIARMRQCAREIASTLTDLQEDVLN